MTTGIHITETALELYILNSHSVAPERAYIDAHLNQCTGCRELYEEIFSYYAELERDFTSSENLPAIKPEELPAQRRSTLQREYWEYITQRQTDLPLPYRIARSIIKHPYITGGTAVLFSGLIIGALMMIFRQPETKPKDMNPTYVEYAGEMMIVKNKSGETLDEIRLGVDMVIWHKGGERHPYVFSDVDDDNINEIIWAHAADSEMGNAAGNASAVSCKSLSKNKILWSKVLSADFEYKLKKERYQSNFVIWRMKAGDFDKNGRPEIIVQVNHNAMFPSFIGKLDPLNGELTDIYVHPGQIHKINFADINDDGITDILVTAISNSFKNASIIILDPRFLSGHSPSTPEYQPSGFSPAKEIAYIRIPRTIVGENLITDAKWNSLEFIEIYEDLKTFRIDVYDASTKGPQPSLQYIFRFDLSVEAIRSGDYYEIIGEELYKKGLIKIMPDEQYLNDFKKEIMYWDGDGWQNRPVQNHYYLEKIKARR